MKERSLVKQLDSIQEFERVSVPETRTKRFRSFVGMVAGEHIAGTEFVIGPLLWAYGVSARDLFLGLLVGNTLAVLSWALICAPLATRVRQTIFYMLERICGYWVVSGYSLMNGLMGAFVGASMIAVSATAIGIPFNISMPGLSDLYPTGPGWIITVICIGSVITIVAMFGYDRVARFANIFAPWMPLVFIGGAVASLPYLGITGWSDFWRVAEERIWTGEPLAGRMKFTFWHVVFFAWLCNTNQHLGLADTTIYRYAKKWYYGFASAAGMFIGHFMAWVASGIMCATALGETAPGLIAYKAFGIAGVICVVVAGWTTANPTIYRSGLAFQAIVPSLKRWKVTLVVGVIITALACFPGVIGRLMEFIAFYALLAAPVGAVVWVDYTLFPKLGLRSNYAEWKQMKVNWIVPMTWLLTFMACLFLHQRIGIEGLEFFLAVPGWILSGLIYIILSKLLQDEGRTA